MIDANLVIGSHDVLLLTLDTLRYDVARACLREGRTPNLAALLPGGAWEERHSPGSFTFAATSSGSSANPPSKSAFTGTLTASATWRRCAKVSLSRS